MAPEEKDDIARRAVSGSAYSIAASAVTLSLGFVRATLMARLLLPEYFGVTTLALFYLNFAGQIRSLGIDSALIHRRDEETDQAVLATYFTLRLALIGISILILLLLFPLLARFYPQMPALLPVLAAFTGISVVKGFNSVQMTVLSKQLAFRQLATTDILSSATMTLVGPALAWSGFGIWSIVAEQFSGVFVRAAAIWLLYRAWRPRLGWDRRAARWFWDYGLKMWTGSNLSFLLDRFDDWWIGSFLGSSPLGFYSRAYEFAGYPRRVVANPIISVFFPAFARLQDDRLRLSRAFFRATSLMVRVGALFSLLFIFTAPEFIELFLGDKWLPMRLTFQLMILYTLLDPLSVAASSLLAATGYPGIIARTRLAQAAIFLPAVILLGSRYGIDGVAVAADLMITAGAVALFAYTRRVADYSQRALWFWPLFALAVAALPVVALAPVWLAMSLWLALLVKAVVMTALYGFILWLAERQQLLTGWQMIWGLIKPAAGKLI